MKKYIIPNIKITSFSVEDIITQSGEIIDASLLTGADKDMYEIYSANSEVKNTNVSVFTW